MARIKINDVEFTVNEIVYAGHDTGAGCGVAVYVCDGVLILDDGNTSEEHEDTPENRERLIAEAQKYDEEWQRDRVIMFDSGDITEA